MKRWIAALCASALLLGFLWFRQPPALRYYRLEGTGMGGKGTVRLEPVEGDWYFLDVYLPT